MNVSSSREPAWRLHLLGEAPRLDGPDGTWHPRGRPAVILAYLALEGPTPRGRLAGLLWPERPERRARANLRQTLLRLRARAPLTRDPLAALDAAVWVDVRDGRDEALASSAEAALLGSIDSSAMPELDEWLARQRERWRARCRQVLGRRIAEARAAGTPDAAWDDAQRLMRLEPWSDSACRTVMVLALEHGDPAAALQAYARLRSVLASELGAAPAADTVALARRAARAASGPADPASPASLAGLRLAGQAEAGGWLEEGARLLASAAAEATAPGELGSVLVGLAWLEHRLGRDAEAEIHVLRGRALLVGGPDTASGAGQADFLLGSLAWARGALDEARRCWRSALAALPSGDAANELRLDLNLALVEDALGNWNAAEAHYRSALPLARSAHDTRAAANILNNLGAHFVARGQHREGNVLLRRGLALARESHDRLLEGYLLDSLARAALGAAAQRGEDPTPARADDASQRAPGLREAARALGIGLDSGDLRLQIEALLTLAEALHRVGERSQSARRAQDALRRAHRMSWGPLVARALVALARALDADDERAVAALQVAAGPDLQGAHERVAAALLAQRGHARQPVDSRAVLEMLTRPER